MKKNSLLLSVLIALVSSLNVHAQTSTLTVLVDSLPYAGFDIIESFNNKLYTLESYKGGRVHEVNTTTGALTHVATLPKFTGSYSYETPSGNFVFMKGKTVAAINFSFGGILIAGGLSSVDTLLNDHKGFSIRNVDTMVYIKATPTSLSAQRLYATDLVNPIVMLDTNVNSIMQAANQKRIYYVVYNAPSFFPILKSSNGVNKLTIETWTGVSSSSGLELTGEVGSDMYFVTYQRTIGMDTTWIKKCDVNGIITVIDTIIRKSSFPRNSGLVMAANKLIIPFTTGLVIYDLTTKTKVDITKKIRTWDWSQDQVAKNHFYFTTLGGASDSTYISDGTLAGTLPYMTSLGQAFETRFENYSIGQSTGNKAIICDEYPIANTKDELYIGNATNAVKYKIFSGSKSSPSHFEQVDGALFFTIHDADFRKVTLMKLDGCDTPMTNPLAIKETSKYNAINSSVYPNPSNGVFNINTKADLQSVVVYNMLGAKVFFNTQKSTLTEIDLSSQASGFYFIKMMDQNGGQSIQKIQVIK